MNILVTNDDGIDSPGIHELSEVMKSFGKVDVIAPSSQQSAVGHALTIENPLRAHSYSLNGNKLGTAVNGTPSDCVKLGISSLLDEKPDLVVSGINFGKNTSINIIYSGTVAAATEGMLIGIPSIAVSLDSWSHSADPKHAAKILKKIIKPILDFGIFPKSLININIPYLPEDKIKGIKITSLSNSVWKDNYEKRKDPFGREYFWFAGEYLVFDKDLESDDNALANGFVSVTPVEFNFSNIEILNKMRNEINFNL